MYCFYIWFFISRFHLQNEFRDFQGVANTDGSIAYNKNNKKQPK